jgi:hypothetical protein
VPTFNVVRSKSPTCRSCGKLLRDYGGYKKTYKRFTESDGSLWVQISDFWDDTRPARQEKTRDSQINELPLQISERAILMATNPGDIVLDCFAGGGSTLHAAHSTGRIWIGADLGVPTSALRRLATFVGTKEVKRPSKKILACFNERFGNEILNLDSLRKRPVQKAQPFDRSNFGVMYAAKSKII